MHNIVLIGFMGSGKSTVGRDLAQKLEMKFVDTDSMIQEKISMTIKEIFKKYGEAYFRKIEKDIVAEASNLRDTIILCGGGVVLDSDNITNLRKTGKTILLKAQPTTLYERIKQDITRPLLDGQMSIEGIEELLKERMEAYNDSADIHIETDGKTVDEISRKIISKLFELKIIIK